MLASLIRDFGNFFFLRIMHRWVAGAEAEDAVEYCKGLGGRCIINYLGEHYKESALADEAVREYRKLADLIASSWMPSSITIKPSQFGFNALDIEDPKSFCEEKLLEVVRYADSKKIMTWLDMEDSQFTDFTLAFYKKYAPKFRLGICLQANLKRTGDDLADLITLSKKMPVRVRLVKGIYVENERIVLTEPKHIHARFLELITAAFENTGADFGIAVGSHHTEAIELAVRLQQEHPKAFFEIEVLKGVLPEYYKALRKRGLSVVEYVPYGHEAFAYSVRRARKNPGFAGSMLFAPFFDAYKKLYG
jgi:proline dehydrogenase